MSDEIIKPDDAKPPQNSALARQHLAAVGRDDAVRFRLVMEDPARKYSPDYRAVELVGTLDQHAQQLRRRNDAGYGVFYQVNSSDGVGAKAENIRGATCFFVDFDGTPLENVKRLLLPPHIEVATSPGKRHFYWRVEGIPLHEFTPVQKRLIALFDSDKSVQDLPRIMRLSGFLHCKNPAAPTLVEIAGSTDAPPYSHREFIAALEAAEAAHGIVPPEAGSSATKRLPASISPPTDAARAAELRQDESALRHIIAVGLLDIDERAEWIRLGIALKTSRGEHGFPLYVALSEGSDKFEGEDDCRKQWNTFKDDKPDGKKLTMATFYGIARANGWKAQPARAVEGSDDAGGKGGGAARGKPDPASIVLDLVEEAGDEIFLDEEGAVYARFPRKASDNESPRIVAPINSDRYAGVLRKRYKLETINKTLPKEQMLAAIALLRAQAVEDNVRRQVFLRIGAHADRIYVDISGDGSTVYEVDGDGWRRADDPPVLFVEGNRGALPIPVVGGTIADLEAHMPNLDLQGRQRALAFAIGTFCMEGTQAMLLIGGGHGNNKSTIGDMVVALSDPPAKLQGARYGFPGDDRDLVIHASNNYVLYFDNVSSFGERESDRLCKLMSGTAFSTRKLHTDAEEQRFAMRRPVVATCIGMPTTRGDLLDRTMPLVAAHQPGTRQRTEAAVWSAFKKDWPKLFGLVLTGVSQALRNREIVQAQVDADKIDPPRLRDFAQFVEGAHQVLGLRLGEFCQNFCQEQSGLQAEAVAGDPFGAALNAYFSVPGATPINATAVELTGMLSNGQREREKGWPSKFKVSSHLQRISPGLADLGIVVKTTKASGKANVTTFQINVDPDFKPGRLTGSEHF